MSNTFFGIAVDCADAAVLAEFWAAVLGRRVTAEASSESAAVEVEPGTGTAPRLGFHRVPEPKTVKNRLHLDLIAADFDAETQRLIDLGATPLNNIEKVGARWTTFADIEGNEFDLIAG
jgi:predicted enzyme related to lactoylglutathione lyase